MCRLFNTIMSKLTLIIAENFKYHLQPLISQILAVKEEVNSIKEKIKILSPNPQKLKSSKAKTKFKDKLVAKTASKASRTKLSNYIKVSNSLGSDKRRHK